MACATSDTCPICGNYVPYHYCVECGWQEPYEFELYPVEIVGEVD